MFLDVNIVIAIVTIVNMKNFRTFQQKYRSNTYHILLNEFSSKLSNTKYFQYFFLVNHLKIKVH